LVGEERDEIVEVQGPELDGKRDQGRQRERVNGGEGRVRKGRRRRMRKWREM
jgi:hypothetical protein